MTHRIDQVFSTRASEGRTTLIPFVTAGDPDPDWTVSIMHALVRGGADLIELGVPFSDSTADGPVIQAASERAIARHVDLAGVLDMVEGFRQENSDTPIVLMGYMNPLERYGLAKFAVDAEAAGVDGLLLVDCPPEELGTLRPAMQAHGLYSIRLVAPTTTETRTAHIVSEAEGFVYYVSFKGITGAGRLDANELSAPIAMIRKHTALPIAVGFGIKDADSAVAVAQDGDAVVIGSALVEQLQNAKSTGAAESTAFEFMLPIRQALDSS